MKLPKVLLAAVLAVMGLAMLAPPVGAAPADTLVVLRIIDSNNYDPQRTAARSGAEVINMLGDTLVTLDPDMKTIRPGLAESWEIKDGGKTYIFHLRKDVKFHDGKPFTADDVVYTFKRWKDPNPKKPVAWRAGPIKEVKALDKYTVSYELTRPDNELLYQLTLFCATIIDKNNVEKLGKDFGVKGFNGTGPYRWVSWTPRNEMILERNPDYHWGPQFYANKGPVKVKRVIWKIVPEESTRVALLQTGQADVSQHLPLWAIKQLEANPNITVQEFKPFSWTYFCGMKITRPMVSDPKVRKAIVAAVNREEIANKLFFGQVYPANSYYPESTIDFDPEVLKLIPHYDPALSKKLLDEAGWKVGPDGFRYKDGKKLSILAYIFTSWRKEFEAVQGYLRKVGVDMQIQAFDSTVAWGKFSTQEFDIMSMSYPCFSVGDALNLYFPSKNMPTPNRSNWNDPWTDKMLAKGQSTMDPKERYAIYSQVQRKVHEACVWLPLYHAKMQVASAKRVGGVKTHGIYGCGLYKGIDLEIVK